MSDDSCQPLLSTTPPAYAATESTVENATIKPDERSSRQPWLWQSKSYGWSLTALILLLIAFTALEFILLKLNLPAVSPENRAVLKFPRNLEELRQLHAVLTVYMEKNFANVYVTYFITYIYLQSLSIPGSMWLSILGGALFNFWLALFTVCLCSAIGSLVAYIISGSLGSVAVMRLAGDRITSWSEQLKQHRKHMFNYILVLRIVPLPPNWTVNLGAPHLGVPIGAFFWGTFFGVAPPSFIHVQAGAALDLLSSSDELNLVTPLNIACLISVAIVALVPVFVRRSYNL